MEEKTWTKEKAQEHARLTMAIKRAKEKGKDFSKLLAEREALKVRVGDYNIKYNTITNATITEKPKSYITSVTKKNNQAWIIVGSSDFKKLRLNNAVIVDKSLLIRAILEAPSEVSLIARPRRWGKSLNLDMLKAFFEIETDVQGQPLPITERGNQKLFTGLKISTDRYSMAQQGQYPVILLNLKETKGNNYQEIENNIKKKIQKTFEQHAYLVNSSQLRPDEKELFHSYLQGKINKADLQESIYFLSKLLAKHFQRNVYILVDEYDEAINDSYTKFSYKSEEFKEIIDLIRAILGSALKQNQYLEKAVLTGILRIAKASFFSGLNNVREYTLLDKRFAEHYGFTQNEVDELLIKVPNIVDSNDLKEWYNGYNFSGQAVYNPLSIMQCLSEGGEFDTYWIDSGNTDLIDQAMLSDDNQAEMQTLLRGKSVTKRLYKQIAFNQIQEDKDLFYSLLVFTGYLNPTPVELGIYELAIPPNREVRKIYEDRVIQWVTRKLNISASDYDNFVGLLLEQKIEKFTERLSHYLLSSTSYHDLIKEKDYHNLMGGLFAPLSRKFSVESNKESGDGRYDHILVPKANNSSNTAFILEYKLCQEKDKFEATAEIGLEQIEKKHYDTQVKQNSQVEEIVKICLTFWKRRVMPKYKIEKV